MAGDRVAATTAAFAPDVVAAAEAGDRVALEVLDAAGGAAGPDHRARGRARAATERVTAVGGLAAVALLVDRWRAHLPDGPDVDEPAGHRSRRRRAARRPRTDLPHEAHRDRGPAVRRRPLASAMDQLATEQVRRDLDDLDDRSPERARRRAARGRGDRARRRRRRPRRDRRRRRAGREGAARGRAHHVRRRGHARPARRAGRRRDPADLRHRPRPRGRRAGGRRPGQRRRAVEGAEDRADLGRADLLALAPGPDDLVVGIAASGRTPYVARGPARPPARAARRPSRSSTTRAARRRGRRRRDRAAHRPGGARRVDPDEGRHGPEGRAQRAVDQRDGAHRQELRRLDGRRRTPSTRSCGAAPSGCSPRRPASSDEEALAALEAAGWRTKTALVAILARVDADVCPRMPSPRATAAPARPSPCWKGRTAMRVCAVASGTSADGLDVAVVDLGLDGRGRHHGDPAHRHGAVARRAARGGAAGAAAGDDDGGRHLPARPAASGWPSPTPSSGPSTCSTARRTSWCRPARRSSTTCATAAASARSSSGSRPGSPSGPACPVVSDLRSRDVAAGGHGAPLASTLDALWLSAPGGPRAALNLGGIANVTIVRDEGEPVVAWDTGPANCLLDVAAARVTDGRQVRDDDGLLAAAGTVRPDLLERAARAPALLRSCRRSSTGREVFSAATSTTSSTASARWAARTCSRR